VEFMASTIKVTPHNEKISENEGSETLPDSPLLDLSDAAVKELIRSAKKRGYVPPINSFCVIGCR
jgi:RNA polymerase primary sigma factor